MSTKQNDEWLNAAKENFEGAVEEGNYQLAKDVIADIFDAGFKNEAYALDFILRRTPVAKFAIKSPYLEN